MLSQTFSRQECVEEVNLKNYQKLNVKRCVRKVRNSAPIYIIYLEYRYTIGTVDCRILV